MKRIILIFAAAVFLGTVAFSAYVFFSRRGAAPGAPTHGGAQEQEIKRYAKDLPGIPQGDTFSIGTKRGSVMVRNFYRTTGRVIEGNSIVLVENPEYVLMYSREDGSFYLAALQLPASAVIPKMEKDFLDRIGVSEGDACKLVVLVTVAGSPGKQFGLSFCPPGV